MYVNQNLRVKWGCIYSDLLMSLASWLEGDHWKRADLKQGAWIAREQEPASSRHDAQAEDCRREYNLI